MHMMKGFDMIEGQSWCEGGRSSLVNDATADHLKHLILLGLLVEHTVEPAGVGGWQLLHLHWLQLISVCYVKQRAGLDARQRGKGGWPEGIDLLLVIDEPADLRAWNSDGNGGGSIFCLTQLIQLWEREEETKHQHCLSELHHINQPSRFPCRSGNLTGKLFRINSSLYDHCYCCIYVYIGDCHPFPNVINSQMSRSSVRSHGSMTTNMKPTHLHTQALYLCGQNWQWQWLCDHSSISKVTQLNLRCLHLLWSQLSPVWSRLHLLWSQLYFYVTQLNLWCLQL